MVVLAVGKFRPNGPKSANGIRRTAQRPPPLPCGERSSVSHYAIFDRAAAVRQGPESHYGSETIQYWLKRLSRPRCRRPRIRRETAATTRHLPSWEGGHVSCARRRRRSSVACQSLGPSPVARHHRRQGRVGVEDDLSRQSCHNRRLRLSRNPVGEITAKPSHFHFSR